GGGDDAGHAIAVDGAGNAWVTGAFRGVTTGIATLTSAGGSGDPHSDIFLLKLTPAGTGFTTAVAQKFGALADDTGTAVTVDSSGNALVAGSFQLSVNFDVRSGESFTLTSAGDADIFVLKLDGGGTFVWARVIGGYKADVARGIATDAGGNVYTTG